MSRFLARALELASGAAPSRSPAPAATLPGSGGCGGFGEREASDKACAPVPEAAAHLSAMVRAHGPDHPEALAAAHGLLAACKGISDDPEERRCEPAWSEVAAEPPPGAWCACCGRREKRGGRWWRERREPKGWACATCHPPDHLDPRDVLEVTT